MKNTNFVSELNICYKKYTKDKLLTENRLRINYEISDLQTNIFIFFYS